MPRVAVIGAVVLLAAVWAGWQLFRAHPNVPQSQQAAVAPPIAAPVAAAPVPGPAAAVPAAVHVQLPDIPRKALGTIRGHFRIGVLVVVDRSGTPLRALLKNTGPSPYFARRSMDAVMKSKFAPADRPGNRQWLVRYEFTRSGVTAVANPES